MCSVLNSNISKEANLHYRKTIQQIEDCKPTDLLQKLEVLDRSLVSELTADYEEAEHAR